MDVAAKVFGRRRRSATSRVEGMVHGRMIRPPVAGAVPVSVDESSIAHIPGAQVVGQGHFIGVVGAERNGSDQGRRKLRVTGRMSKAPFSDRPNLYNHIRNAP